MGNKFWDSNVKFVNVAISPEEAENIALDDEPFADVLSRLIAFVDDQMLQFKVTCNPETLTWTAQVYVNLKDHRYYGMLLQAKAPIMSLAIRALDYKLSVLDGRDWSAFVRAPERTHGIS